MFSKTTFSRRQGFEPDLPVHPVVEDAPGGLRFEFIKYILEPVLYVDQDARYPNSEHRPVPAKRLGEELYLISHEEPPAEIHDSWLCKDAVKDFLRACEWNRFYDCIERVGSLINEAEANALADLKTTFDQYRSDVNMLFQTWRVVWRLDQQSELKRELPNEMEQGVGAVEESLAEGHHPAYVAYVKARRFLTEVPLDAENAIKEIVSATESVGRSIYPGTSTLGDVVREMRKAGFPPGMASIIEKFYAFASSTPSVRHGGVAASNLSVADADFCLHLGTALIRYLLTVAQKAP